MTAIRVLPGQVTLGRVAQSEWIKFTTLRSTLPLHAATVAALAGMGLLPAIAATSMGSGLSSAVAAQDVLGSMSWVQLIVAISGVVFITSEYTSGSAQTTYVAVPTRVPVLLTKQLVVAMTAAIDGTAGAAIAIGGTTLLFRDSSLGRPFTPELATQLIAGAGLYLAAIAALSVALGAVIRNLVAGILTTTGILTIAPLAVGLVPVQWIQATAPYFPATAGQALLTAENPAAVLTPWAGYVVLLAWTGATNIVAGILLRVRDV
jgi:ABC-2 type transport system permease protein